MRVRAVIIDSGAGTTNGTEVVTYVANDHFYTSSGTSVFLSAIPAGNATVKLQIYSEAGTLGQNEDAGANNWSLLGFRE
jgi:hypothetical protein